MDGYNKYVNKRKEPMILESKDWTGEEFKVIQKLFHCPETTTRIKITFDTIEWFEESIRKMNGFSIKGMQE